MTEEWFKKKTFIVYICKLINASTFLQESEIERLSSLEEELQKKSEECEELKKVLKLYLSIVLFKIVPDNFISCKKDQTDVNAFLFSANDTCYVPE